MELKTEAVEEVEFMDPGREEKHGCWYFSKERQQETSHVRFGVHEKELRFQPKTLRAKAKIQNNYFLMFKLAQKVIGFPIGDYVYFMWAHSPFMTWFSLWYPLPSACHLP